MVTNKKFSPTEEEEPLLKKVVGPSAKASSVARPTMRQRMIPTGVVIKEMAIKLLEATPVVAVAIPTLVAPTISLPPENLRRKRPRSDKETIFSEPGLRSP